MAASAGLRRVGTGAERGLREEGGDWRAARGVGRGASFTFSFPSAPSFPSHYIHTLFAREPGELAA